MTVYMKCIYYLGLTIPHYYTLYILSTFSYRFVNYYDGERLYYSSLVETLLIYLAKYTAIVAYCQFIIYLPNNIT